jgi:LmbE family N-acetylglucosaminyl deacetylase
MARLGPEPALDGTGTPESEWQRCRQLHRMPPWTVSPPPTNRCVVVAPHPDDEVLGAGGAASLLAASGIEIVLVAVTDGENSHPGREAELRYRRPLESAAAAATLGLSPLSTLRLGHPDGGVAEGRLTGELAAILQTGDLVLAPWPRDGHPDHDRTGTAASVAARRRDARLFSYLVWAWHWADPWSDIPWERSVRVDLGTQVASRKRRAARCFTTQLCGSNPILSTATLERLLRPFEVLIKP